MNDILEVLFKNISVFSMHLEELLQKYCCSTYLFIFVTETKELTHLWFL